MNESLFKGENKSYFKFRLKVKNIGSSPIENPKLIIHLEGNHEIVEDENFDVIFVPQKVETDVEINRTQGDIFVTHKRNVLALEEEYLTNYICIKPKLEGAEIDLHWTFISNHLKKEGDLK